MRESANEYNIRFVAGLLDETALRALLEQEFDVNRCSIERAPWSAVETPRKAMTVRKAVTRRPGREKAKTAQPERRNAIQVALDPAEVAKSFPILRGKIVQELARVGEASTEEISSVLKARGVRSADHTRVHIQRLREKGFLVTVRGKPGNRHHLTELGERLHQELRRLNDEAR
ncbi:hypothetical protein [Rubellimicrobium arenae]|uniref:hypothetical protein n=1 Tax=Rubellimicrobium arenae TaxID=2817372 RepID=UPI001B302619|nr:hypothetical protein [Rubellimicrobium arenae]